MRMLRQPVVGDPKCGELRFRQVPDLDDGDAWHPQLLCCKHPAMPDDDMTGGVDHHRHDETEFADAVRDLVDLALRMLPRVTGIEDKVLQWPIFDLDLDQAGIGCRRAAHLESGGS